MLGGLPDAGILWLQVVSKVLALRMAARRSSTSVSNATCATE